MKGPKGEKKIRILDNTFNIYNTIFQYPCGIFIILIFKGLFIKLRKCPQIKELESNGFMTQSQVPMNPRGKLLLIIF